MSNTFHLRGRHWMATLRGVKNMTPQFIQDVVKTSLQDCGATIVGYNEHIFDNNAITCCFLLCESHCTVHTYPEVNSLWIDCFTCGENFNVQKFQQLIILHLHTEEIDIQLIRRN